MNWSFFVFSAGFDRIKPGLFAISAGEGSRDSLLQLLQSAVRLYMKTACQI